MKRSNPTFLRVVYAIPVTLLILSKLFRLSIFLIAISVPAFAADDCPTCQPAELPWMSSADNAERMSIYDVDVLNRRDILVINRNVCSTMEDYLGDIKIGKAGYSFCTNPPTERKALCKSYPDQLEPKHFIAISIAERLEKRLNINTQAELDQILPKAIAQLMEVPCKRLDKREPDTLSFGDNFIKRAMTLRKVDKVLGGMMIPLCQKQPDYQACIRLFLSTTETIIVNGKETEESIIHFGNKLQQRLVKQGALKLNWREQDTVSDLIWELIRESK